jgi:NAD kinase
MINENGGEMMMLFDHFPQDKTVCPICGTNDDKPCFLMPIDGREYDRICEAQPTHGDCLRDHADQFRMNRDEGIVYASVANASP